MGRKRGLTDADSCTVQATGLGAGAHELFGAVELPCTDLAVPLLRRWVRGLLAQAPEVVHGIELIASEYATNALWHSASGSPGGRIRAELLLAADSARISLYDQGALNERPSSGASDDPDEHGRGLVLVHGHADQHGGSVLPDGRHLAWAVLNR
jgi:anti-sigma regulatory factor (Ser/Thr protein kinase)